MKFAFGIQCRDNSTRMKHKAVRPFYKGRSILQIIVERLKFVGFRNIYVLTTKNSPKTVEICKKTKTKYFIGSEDNVLDRFCQFIHRYEPEGIFRICADNPLVALGLMYPIRSFGKSGEYDYVSFNGAMQRHEGLFTEYVSSSALLRVRNNNPDKYDKEHVTAYIWRHPEEFNCEILPLPYNMKEIPVRLTVDTKSDFKIAQKIYRVVGETYWGNIYDFIQRQPALLERMKKNIEENKK